MKLSIRATVLAAASVACAAAAVHFVVDGQAKISLFLLAALVALSVVFWRLTMQPIRRIERTVFRLAQKNGAAQDTHRTLDGALEALLEEMQRALRTEYATQMLKKQAELNALQSQINPHFLYNTLESIRGQALMEGMDEIADMIEALSLFFRYSISNTGAMVTLEDELDNVRNYIKIQQFRFGDRIRLETEIEAKELLEGRVPKMTLQPIVENAVQHGMEAVKGQGCITVQVQADDAFVEIRVCDNGIGMSDEETAAINASLDRPVNVRDAQESHTGIALTNVCQRIQLCYGAEYGLHVFSTQGVGTQVTVLLPRDRLEAAEAWRE